MKNELNNLLTLERGNRNAKPETWERIAAALGCSVSDLFEKEAGNHEDA